MKKNECFSFTELYEHHRHTVLQHAFFYCKDRELAKDISQEVFIKLWKQKEILDGITDMNAFLFTITRNLVLTHFRKQEREQINKRDLLQHYRQFYPPPEVEVYDEKVFENVYHNGLRQLTNRQRIVFELIREEKIKFKQVAQLLQLSENTVTNTMQRAKKKLGQSAWQQLRQPEFLEGRV